MVARRFIVEQGPEAVANVLGKLDRAGRFASFDLLGEAVLSEEEAQRYIHGYVNLLASLGNHRLAGQRTARGALKLEVSLKLTALTAQFRPEDPEGTLDRVRPALERLFAAARDAGVGVTVDAEQYPYRDLTWRIVRETLGSGRPFESWPDAGVVVQAYLRDVEEHVRDVAAFISHRGVPMGVRLVKGAYWDHEVISAEQNGWPASVFQNKGATDIAYERAVRTLLEAAPGVRLAVASHNLRTHAHAEAVAESLGLPRHAVEHQTLHRTSEEVSRALADVGWVSRDYVPVGELNPGMAYLVRRILENTSQVGVLIKARAREDVEELLRPPAAGADDTAYRHGRHASGFANTPTVRLFDDGQRGDFRRALNNTRERWGGTYPLRVGGEELTTNAPEPSISPSHHDPAHPVGWVHRASPAEVTKALRLANAAAPAWSRRSLDERSRIGRRAAELLRERKMEVAAWVVHEGGRSWREALADVEEGIDHIEWSARQLLHLAPRIEGVYRPRGVVACIPPWNFPVALPAASVGAALMAGNAVILKSAEHTPIIAGLLTDVLHDAGVPRDVLIHLPGPGSTVGAALVDSSDVDLVAFTGSKSTGLSILERAARVHPARAGIKRVVAEMGGKNAIVVYPDADMDEAIAGILASAFGHAGQKCSACSRVLVHRDVYPTLQRRLIEAARSLPVGPADEPGTAVNPVISPRAREQIAAYASIARDEGRVLLDRIEERAGDACTIGPLLVEIDARNAAASRIAHEEVFGPVLPLIPFSSGGGPLPAGRYLVRPDPGHLFPQPQHDRAVRPRRCSGQHLRQPDDHGRTRRHRALRRDTALRHWTQGRRRRGVDGLPDSRRALPRRRPSGLRGRRGRGVRRPPPAHVGCGPGRARRTARRCCYVAREARGCGRGIGVLELRRNHGCRPGHRQRDADTESRRCGG